MHVGCADSKHGTRLASLEVAAPGATIRSSLPAAKMLKIGAFLGSFGDSNLHRLRRENRGKAYCIFTCSHCCPLY